MYLLLLFYMLGTPQLYPFRHWVFRDEMTGILVPYMGSILETLDDVNKKIYKELRAGKEGWDKHKSKGLGRKKGPRNKVNTSSLKQ